MAFVIGLLVGVVVGYFMWGRGRAKMEAALNDALGRDTDDKSEQ